jgi:prepilin-type N-terminal cleavage/methylation domain-containing protein
VKSQKGFTVIELVFVMLITCILATMVATVYSGAQANNRNKQRQADIDKVQNRLEMYYAQYTKYPTILELNNAIWREKNLTDLSNDAVTDPKWDNNKNCMNADKTIAFSSMPKDNCYSYQVAASDGASCSTEVACAQYTLTTMLEGGQKYTKSSPN